MPPAMIEAVPVTVWLAKDGLVPATMFATVTVVVPDPVTFMLAV